MAEKDVKKWFNKRFSYCEQITDFMNKHQLSHDEVRIVPETDSYSLGICAGVSTDFVLFYFAEKELEK